MVLSDVFNLQLPDCPAMRSATTSSTTRRPTKTERTQSSNKQLQWVVYDEDMADRVVGEALKIAEKVNIDEQDEKLRTKWRGRVYPEHTATLLPDVINSEQDAREWIHQVLVQPALGCLRATHHGDISGIDLKELIVASSPAEKHKVIADGLFYTNRVADKRVLCLEYKTSNSLLPDQFLFRQADLHYSERRQGIRGKQALRFFWPGRKASRLAHDTKILVQVWSEMMDNDVRHCILSSYQTTFFLYRPADMSNTLFVSKNYQVEAGQRPGVMGLIYSWMLSSLGEIDIKLPPVDSDWMQALGDYYEKEARAATTGLDRRTAVIVAERLRTAGERRQTGIERQTGSADVGYLPGPLAQVHSEEEAQSPQRPRQEAPPGRGPDTRPTGRVTPPPHPRSPDATPKASRIMPASAHGARQPPPPMEPSDAEDRQEGASRGVQRQRGKRGSSSGATSRGRKSGGDGHKGGSTR